MENRWKVAADGVSSSCALPCPVLLLSLLFALLLLLLLLPGNRANKFCTKLLAGWVRALGRGRNVHGRLRIEIEWRSNANEWLRVWTANEKNKCYEVVGGGGSGLIINNVK